MDKMQSFWKNSTYVVICYETLGLPADIKHSSAVMPGLARMQQSVKEQFGQADDKVRRTFLRAR
jgi:hypothetical protein